MPDCTAVTSRAANLESSRSPTAERSSRGVEMPDELLEVDGVVHGELNVAVICSRRVGDEARSSSPFSSASSRSRRRMSEPLARMSGHQRDHDARIEPADQHRPYRGRPAMGQRRTAVSSSAVSPSAYSSADPSPVRPSRDDRPRLTADLHDSAHSGHGRYSGRAAAAIYHPHRGSSRERRTAVSESATGTPRAVRRLRSTEPPFLPFLTAPGAGPRRGRPRWPPVHQRRPASRPRPRSCG